MCHEPRRGEEHATHHYETGFEAASLPADEQLFANVGESAYGIPQIETPQLPDCYGCSVTQSEGEQAMQYDTQDNSRASKLNGSGRKVGASLALKVMAGDNIDLGVNAWHPDKSESSDDIPPEDLTATLLSLFSGGVGAISGGHLATTLAGSTESPLANGIKNFLDGHPAPGALSTEPSAYINWVLFDENLKYVPEGSGFIKTGAFSADMQTLAQQGLTMPAGGYLFVFLSNETEHYDVFFDNIVINHTPGAVLEETHYYPFGLVMKGISYKAAVGVQNKKKYNGKELQNEEFSDNSGLEWEDYGARMQDPQLGRWFSIDPLADKMRRHSPYNYAFDNPIRFIDADGMQPNDTVKQYHTVPQEMKNALPGFEGSSRLKYRKGARPSWDIGKGKHAEWDYQHGEVEVYDKKGKHQGAFNPKTGELIKVPVPNRNPTYKSEALDKLKQKELQQGDLQQNQTGSNGNENPYGPNFPSLAPAATSALANAPLAAAAEKQESGPIIALNLLTRLSLGTVCIQAAINTLEIDDSRNYRPW